MCSAAAIRWSRAKPTGPGGIDVLGGYELPPDAAEAERRLALAKWLGSEEHPLTARVLVNRVWRHHFGAGLVDTPSDFGTQGERPTHPELLDWLASEFMARGWKLKELHRLICTSAAYRQSSRPGPGRLADRCRRPSPVALSAAAAGGGGHSRQHPVCQRLARPENGRAGRQHLPAAVQARCRRMAAAGEPGPRDLAADDLPAAGPRRR